MTNNVDHDVLDIALHPAYLALTDIAIPKTLGNTP